MQVIITLLIHILIFMNIFFLKKILKQKTDTSGLLIFFYFLIKPCEVKILYNIFFIIY